MQFLNAQHITTFPESFCESLYMQIEFRITLKIENF